MAKLKIATAPGRSRLAILVDEYLANCRARGLSPKTVRDNYGYALGIFLEWCEREKLSSLEQLDNRVLDRYTAHLLENGGKRGPLSRHSIASFTEAVNWWLRWLKAEGEMDRDAMAPVPRRPQRVIDVLSREEIQQLEDAAKPERDKLIVRLLADTGIRSGELLNLKVGDLVERDRNHYVRVHGKGEKERLVPIPRLARRVKRYIDRERPKDAVTDFVFLSLRRGRSTGGFEPLTKSGIEQLVRNLAEIAGITRRVHPHLLRHSYATWALTRGMNPIMLAQVLGHNSLVMIQRTYAHQTPADAHDQVARMLAADT